MRDVDRRRYEQLRADRQVIDQAAACLRRQARNDQYVGLLHRPEVVFAVAAILDELSRHLDELSTGVRWQVVQSCRTLLGLLAA